MTQENTFFADYCLFPKFCLDEKRKEKKEKNKKNVLLIWVVWILSLFPSSTPLWYFYIQDHPMFLVFKKKKVLKSPVRFVLPS